MNMPQTTYTNQLVTLRKDLIFGWVVLSTYGWTPIDQLDRADLTMVKTRMMNDAMFPADAYAAIQATLDGNPLLNQEVKA
jgi:hypothetical protein